MGTWGEGNFQDDQTLDWLETMVFDPLVQFVEDNIATRDPLRSREVVAAVDVLVTLYEHYEQPPPGVRRVARWRDAYLAAWERTDFGHAVPAFLAERRPVIEETFARLLGDSSNWEDLDDEPAEPPRAGGAGRRRSSLPARGGGQDAPGPVAAGGPVMGRRRRDRLRSGRGR